MFFPQKKTKCLQTVVRYLYIFTDIISENSVNKNKNV